MVFDEDAITEEPMGKNSALRQRLDADFSDDKVVKDSSSEGEDSSNEEEPDRRPHLNEPQSSGKSFDYFWIITWY